MESDTRLGFKSMASAEVILSGINIDHWRNSVPL